mgnify:FL=1
MAKIKQTVITLHFFIAALSITYSQVPQFGSDTLLDVGCWNLEWFGSTGYGPTNEQLQFNNVKQVVNNTDIDIWGFTEMSSYLVYQQLLADLPQYGGALASYNQTQKTALFYKKDMFEVISSNHILTSSSFNYDFASRPPLEVVLKTKSFIAPDTIYAIVIHLKAFADQESYDRRKGAVTALKNYMDFIRKDKKTIVLGDWNDDLDQSTFNGIETPFQILLDDPADYFFPTKALSDAGKTSYAFYSGSFLDHIMVTTPLTVDYIPSSAKVLDMMPTYISNFSQNTSDHYPVISAFHLDNIQSLGVQSPSIDEQLFAVAADRATVFALGEWEGTVEIYAVDGTKTGEFEKQAGQLEIPVDHLPQGMYIAALQLKTGTKTYKFVR